METDFQCDVCEIPDYTGRLSHSLKFTIPSGSRGKKIRFFVSEDGEWVDIAFNAHSFRHPQYDLKSAGVAHYGVDVGELIEVAIGEYDTVTVPYRPFEHFDIVVLTDEADVLIINDLRCSTDVLPQDILEGFLDMELPKIPLGQVRVEQYDRHVELPVVLPTDSVVEIDGERYQLEVVGTRATFKDEYRQEIPRDFEGECYLVTTARIGYYDQDVAFPSVVLWYSSPAPDLRTVRREEYRVFGDFAYVKARTQYEKWTVHIEVVGATAEMIQHIASYVRRFLETNRVYVNGKKFTFEWTQQAVDTDPTTYLDIKPSVAYVVEISLQEEFLWQVVQKGSGKLRTAIPRLG